ncbi:MAG: DUF4312 family protein [Erysipelotrichaceae bacterium]|nr:DUF4312 family protein [Erysipelotrichaceae bacterium]
MEKNSLTHKEMLVEIKGVSRTSKEDAVNAAFRNLRAEIAKKDNCLIVYMKPTAVYVKELQTEEYTEKFLFFFMPRKKENVKVTLEVAVEYEALEI